MQDLGRFAPLWRFAEELADAARAVCLGYFRADNKTVGVRQKSDDSPVTRADRACERALRALIGRRFPAHRVIGEEFGRAGGDDAESSPTWVLDPIDGTRSFLGGSPLFCSLIAYAENGRPLLGVIDMPALGERWIGIDAVANGARIRAAQKNAAACRVSKCRLLARARGGVSTIGLPGRERPQGRGFAAAFCRDSRTLGRRRFQLRLRGERLFRSGFRQHDEAARLYGVGADCRRRRWRDMRLARARSFFGFGRNRGRRRGNGGVARCGVVGFGAKCSEPS